METEQLIELVRRGPVLDVLRKEGVADRRDLEEHLEVSRSTVHRFTRSLRDSGLIDRTADGFVLTPLGEISAREVAEFESTIGTAWELAPVLEAASASDIRIDPEAFSDVTVTSAEPGNPYRPVNRFMTLVEGTETLRGLDPASINPLHLEDLYERIVGGMNTEVVFPSSVVWELLSSNPDRARDAFESGNLSILVHDELPFGLTLCDERIGVGVYDDEVGLLRTYADTVTPAAREWAEDVYAEYRADSTPLTEHAEFSQLSSL